MCVCVFSLVQYHNSQAALSLCFSVNGVLLFLMLFCFVINARNQLSKRAKEVLGKRGKDLTLCGIG